MKLRVHFRLSVFLAACAAFLPMAAHAAELHRGNGSDPTTLDPQRATGAWENNVIGDLFIGLMTEDVNGEAVPGVAESFGVSADGLTYEFKLRPGLQWSDGEALTAKDFVFSFRRLMDPADPMPFASLGDVIENGEAVRTGAAPVERLGVSAPTSDRVVVRLATPTPYLLELFTHFAFYPTPEHAVSADPDGWAAPGNIVSNGPFRLASWTPGETLRLEKNPRFFDADAVALDAVVYHPIADDDAAVDLFAQGRLHMNSDYPAHRADWIDENLPGARHTAPYLALTYVTFNTRKPPFDDVRVRKALSLLIPRAALADGVMKDGSTPAWTMVPPGVANYSSPDVSEVAGMDRYAREERARELLRQAGYTPSNPLRFTYRHRDSLQSFRIAKFLRSLWRQGGNVIADLERSPNRDHYAALGAGDFEAGDAGWIADYNDASSFLFLLRRASPQLNYGAFSHDGFEAAMDAAAAEADVAERAQKLQEAEAIVIDQRPVAPLVFQVRRELVAASVAGWSENVKGIHRSRWLSLNG